MRIGRVYLLLFSTVSILHSLCACLFMCICVTMCTYYIYCSPGHPIANDPLYYRASWGPSLGRGGVDLSTVSQVMDDLFKSGIEFETENDGVDGDGDASSAETAGKSTNPPSSTQMGVMSLGNPLVGGIDASAAVVNGSVSRVGGEEAARESAGSIPGDGAGAVASTLPGDQNAANACNVIHSFTAAPSDNAASVDGRPDFPRDANCVECCANRRLPRTDELCIWLHAMRYSGPGFDFSTPLPAWAAEDFGGDIGIGSH
eukprot:Opistho-2@78129